MEDSDLDFFFAGPALQEELRYLADVMEKDWVPRYSGMVMAYERNPGFISVPSQNSKSDFLGRLHTFHYNLYCACIYAIYTLYF